MGHPFPVFSIMLFGWLALAAPSAEAQPNDYQDLAAWADQDAHCSFQMHSDIKQANSASKMAAAIQATAVRQRKTTDDIIKLVRVHPELRNMPTLGLDYQGLCEWVRSHPDAATRLHRAPPAAIAISRHLQLTIAPAIREAPADAIRIRKYMRDPQIIAAMRTLDEVVADNRRRLLHAFS